MILARLGVADNMRLSFWNFFRDSYELSPFYLGRGIQYTDNRMILSSTKGALRITNNVGIHNDILRTYIGWGCIPFLYYYYNLFVLNLKKIKEDLIMQIYGCICYSKLLLCELYGGLYDYLYPV